MAKQGKRYVVVGDVLPNSTRADTYPWQAAKLPNVTDFEVAILDLRSLQTKFSDMTQQALVRFRDLAARLIDSGGQIVAITGDPTANLMISNPGQRSVNAWQSSVL